MVSEGVRSFPPLVEMVGVAKRFGSVVALDDVSFTLGRAEVLGLVGDNAAGKSTLVKTLNGVYKPDAGRILIEGTDVHFDSPSDARSLGIEMIYQEFALVDSLDIAANIFLGKELAAGGLSPLTRFLRKGRMDVESTQTLQTLGIELRDVHVRVSELSGGERQLVAIARGMHFQPKLFIMDEPTANLSLGKIEILHGLIRQLKGLGVAIILISHKLDDVFAIADRVMVLRHGRVVGNFHSTQVTPEKILKVMMFGAEARDRDASPPASPGSTPILWEQERQNPGGQTKSASV